MVSSFAPVLHSANWYLVESFWMSFAVSLSKPYCSIGVVEVDVSASETSVLAEEEKSAADDDIIPPDQEAVGKILLLMTVLRPAQESIKRVGSLAAIVVKIAPECAIRTQGASSVVSFVS